MHALTGSRGAHVSRWAFASRVAEGAHVSRWAFMTRANLYDTTCSTGKLICAMCALGDPHLVLGFSTAARRLTVCSLSAALWLAGCSLSAVDGRARGSGGVWDHSLR